MLVSHIAGVSTDAGPADIAEFYDGPYTLAADRQIFSI